MRGKDSRRGRMPGEMTATLVEIFTKLLDRLTHTHSSAKYDSGVMAVYFLAGVSACG